MPEANSHMRASPAQILAAWSVHVLTASGAVWGLLALDAIVRVNFRAALGWMALAVLIDGIDGALARRARVKVLLPFIDGTLLDNLLDYFNYVVVPAFLMLRAGLLAPPVVWAGPAAILIASAFQFTHTEAKTADRYRGFPSYWNVLAAYLLLLGADPWLASGIVALLCVLVFVPVGWIHPTRTRELRRTTLALTVAWGVAMGLAVWWYPAHPRWLVVVSLTYVVYYAVLSLALSRRR